MTADPTNLSLHFEADLLAVNEQEAHRRRGSDQWVCLGSAHPVATWFAQRVQDCPAPHPDTMKRVMLHDILEPLASVCSRGATPSHTMDQCDYIY